MTRSIAVLLAVIIVVAIPLRSAAQTDAARWRAQAARVTIVRDDWGIAHIHGTTDADAVFGTIYAQAEDDFDRVETNYINALGRAAEVEGAPAIYRDLREKLFVDPVALRRDYAASPPALQALMRAWADGLNYYLAVHPAVHPRLIRHFEPWMALSFTEGSIGGDVERISLDALHAFYPGKPYSIASAAAPRLHDMGSNGIAIAPADTIDHHALLLINPHTSFYFRSELHMMSDRGLDACGAVTWGQFFIYQGFNEHVGWMHTSTGVDNVDFFAERVVRRGRALFYRYGDALRPLKSAVIRVPFRTNDGRVAHAKFTVYYTHRGPIVARRNRTWIDVALMQRPIAALSQSFYRTKAIDYASYRAIADRYKANSSNNTIFADSNGEIAFMTPQFIPRRDDRFDYTKPVDGSNPAADWHGLHTLDEDPHVVNPPTGWVFNSNDWPYASAGPASPKRSDYPRYMDTAGENQRGVHDLRLLTGRTDFSLDALVSAAYDTYLPGFADLVPRVIAAFDRLRSNDPRRADLAAPIEILRRWDYRWSASSVATALAVYYGEALAQLQHTIADDPMFDRLRAASPQTQVAALMQARQRLTADFGTWNTPWGNINRFQRRNGAIVQQFADDAPSIPVGFTTGFWGSLAAFDTVQTGTKRRYGVGGNSFVAVVEFGPRVRARAVTAGGASGHPESAHFSDQALRYSTGDLRDVYFYPEQLQGHTERTYHPG